MASIQELEEKILSRQWFYRFQLPSGRYSDCYLAEYAQPIHTTRERMMNDFLDRELGNSIKELTSVDLACHEGFFSHKLASKGFKKVTGVDARSEHIENANLIREVYEHNNLSFQTGDIQTMKAGEIGQFDVTLLFGILYHLENVVGALRLAQSITKRICLMETQIVPNMTGVVDWGSYKFNKDIVGCLGIIDETAESDGNRNKESNLTPITLVPSLPGLLWLLKAVGFSRTEVLEPPSDAYEQLVSKKRVIVAAYNEG
jgi:tRNA (mo5U34)-methyltransferase